MKKTRIITVALLIFAAALSVFALNSCGGNDEPTKLDAPVVTLDGDVAKWSADASADKFEISIDGALSFVENTVTEKKLKDGETFKVRAVGDGTNYATGDWSNQVTYKAPEAPETTYTVIWMNGDTVLEKDENVKAGTMPSYDGDTPTREADAQYTYAFGGWSPVVSEVTESVTYVARFTETVNKYTVTFYSDDGTSVLDSVTVEYAKAAEYSSDIPTKSSTEQYEYSFDKWVTAKGGYIEAELGSVKENISVYASFTESVRKYTVSFELNNSAFGMLSATEIKDVPYGTAVTVNGNTVAVGDALVSVTLAGDNEYFDYELAGFSAPAFVTGDVTVTANISRSSLQSFSVNFYSEDGAVLLYTALVGYEESAEFPLTLPTKEENEYYSYSFLGWYTAKSGGESADLSSITSDKDVFARFNRVAKVTFTVTFTDYDGAVIAEETVSYGETAALPENPEKSGADFIGWQGNFTYITKDETVKAIYSDTKNVFKVSSVKGAVGDTVTVLVEIQGDVKICGFDIKLTYDSEMLEIVSCNNDMELAVVVNTEIADNVFVNYSGTSDKTVQRDIIELTFKIKENAKGATAVGVSVTSAKEMDGEKIIDTEYELIDGVVEISD